MDSNCSLRGFRNCVLDHPGSSRIIPDALCPRGYSEFGISESGNKLRGTVGFGVCLELSIGVVEVGHDHFLDIITMVDVSMYSGVIRTAKLPRG